MPINAVVSTDNTGAPLREVTSLPVFNYQGATYLQSDKYFVPNVIENTLKVNVSA